jgi:hypothetical protein
MSNPNEHDVLTTVSELLKQLQGAVNDPSRLPAIVRQKAFGDALQSVYAIIAAKPSNASDHTTEDQLADAVRVCEDLVTAFIVGEDPASINWSSLDSCNELARKVLGQERVHELYKLYRPEQLPGYIDDVTTGFAAIR